MSNRRQTIALVVGGLALIALSVYPPHEQYWQSGPEHMHGWVWQTHDYTRRRALAEELAAPGLLVVSFRVDTGRLLCYALGIAASTLIAVVLLGLGRASGASISDTFR
jgi:hypothetical protein